VLGLSQAPLNLSCLLRHLGGGKGTLQGSGRSILEVHDIKKSFFKRGASKRKQETVEVLGGVNFTLKEGSFTSVVGPSGCGKTTLLRIVDGLIQPDSGEVKFDGKPVTSPHPKMAFVFQLFGLLPWRTVMKNVEFGLELRNVDATEREAVAKKYIELVGLAGFENHFAHELSGGMQQRVGLARALSVDPDVLLMDEPFASVDMQTREILQRQLLQIMKGEVRKTTLFVTHNIDEAIYLSDEIVLLSTLPGTVKEIIEVNLPGERWKYDPRTVPEFAQLRHRIWKFLENEIMEKNLFGSITK
jgi:NitT/TauT family transport system ATP-binding protein